MKTAAYGVFDDVRSVEHLFKLILSHGLGHDKQWRLRFVIAPTEQLRINFEVVPKLDASWDSRRYRENRFQSPTTLRDDALEEADQPRRSCLQLTRMDSRPQLVRPLRVSSVRPLGRMIVARFIPKACASGR